MNPFQCFNFGLVAVG